MANESAVVTLGVLKDHDELLKTYIDNKEIDVWYGYLAENNNVSITDGETTCTETVTDADGTILATKVSEINTDGTAIVETITITGESPVYYKWSFNSETGAVTGTMSTVKPSLG